MSKEELYARKAEFESNIRWQTLAEHARNVADLAKSFDVLGLEETIYLTALLHDVGKATDEFQNYIKNGGQRGDVRHSAPSAKAALDYLMENNVADFFIEAMAMCITAHHSELYDGLSVDGKSEFVSYINGNLKVSRDARLESFHRNKIYSALKDLLPIGLIERVNAEISLFLKRIKTVEAAPFMLNAVARYIYSCVVDADREDARNFEKDAVERKKIGFDILTTRLENYLAGLEKLDGNPQIKKYRREVSDACAEAGKKEIGIYKLEVPTGGGKTLASLRFALKHIQEKKLERVIYVVPFLSIIEQTAQTLHKALEIPNDGDLILEHHSNYIPSDNGVDEEQYRYMESRWDSPIIVTTAVQFLESLFSHKAGVQRKFHNMANSVIIFDEIQSLPQKCFHMFNTMANFLSQFCNSTILLCSATQIPLNKADLPIRIKGDLLERIETVLPSRTKIVPRLNPDRNILIKEYDYAALAAEIFDNNENALLIVNTKKDALNVYNELKKNQNDGLALFHLSANMCVQNRLDAIGKIKKSLEDTSERTICVSTQLIEAGVDLSFGCVYRVLAGLDSIVQAAGRCNRNGEYSDPKEVYIVKIKDGGLSKLPSIKQAAEITEALLSDDKCREDLLSQYSVDKFYGQILEKNKNEFDYPIKNATLYDLHCCNNKGFGAFRNANGGNLTPPFLRCAFRTVGEEFYLIDKNGVTVYVPYNDEAKRLIARFKRGERSADLFTKLGGYSVNLFQYQVDKLNGGVTRTEDFYFINEKYYNDETGIITDSDDLLLV